MRIKPLGILQAAILLLGACSNTNQIEDIESATHADDDTEIMTLGDTAEITAIFGHYDLTIDAVHISDDLNGKEAENAWVYLVDYTLTNTGKETIEFKETYKATLLTMADGGHSSGNLLSVNALVAEGPLDPDESYNGQFLFDHEEGQKFELVHNYGSAATEALWQFSIEDANQ